MKKQIMTTEEKEDFLENDFIERLIRIEQRISAKFGKLIPYNKTRYYTDLSEENKKRYKKYLADKKKKKTTFLMTFVLAFFGIFFVNFNITGNVIKENVGGINYSILSIVSIIILFLLIVLMAFIFIKKKNKKKKYDILFQPLEKITKNKKDL